MTGEQLVRSKPEEVARLPPPANHTHRHTDTHTHTHTHTHTQTSRHIHCHIRTHGKDDGLIVISQIFLLSLILLQISKPKSTPADEAAVYFLNQSSF